MPKNKNRKQTPASDGDAAAPELPATHAADASIDSASSTHHALQPESETHDAVQAESTASSDANAIAAALSRRVDFVDDEEKIGEGNCTISAPAHSAAATAATTKSSREEERDQVHVEEVKPSKGGWGWGGWFSAATSVVSDVTCEV
jgi:hypothetical protein